ncbi:acidic leucine-rich nuclear phosphoprotein 32 family member E-like [Paramacrobiotus metropolitanus]|uniref:acidic leucine-rich nuclear phosphoprotein 32 family member E-like n=1 Tax=Paramacrobiotus metropolitanus TaxID=2943436 RepID=UPI0024458035|nr:acidic leucine-rich nuclear phosphoprotein 32 family member E-like [Paramacrobiotus metropolitanus]
MSFLAKLNSGFEHLWTLPPHTTSINLDGRRLEVVNGRREFEALTAFPNLTVLSMRNCDLYNLGAIPFLPNLQTLILNDNNLLMRGCVERLVKQCPNLIKLSFADNWFGERSAFHPLMDLTKLKELDLFRNPVWERHVPQLFLLDFFHNKLESWTVEDEVLDTY